MIEKACLLRTCSGALREGLRDPDADPYQRRQGPLPGGGGLATSRRLRVRPQWPADRDGGHLLRPADHQSSSCQAEMTEQGLGV